MRLDPVQASPLVERSQRAVDLTSGMVGQALPSVTAGGHLEAAVMDQALETATNALTEWALTLPADDHRASILLNELNAVRLAAQAHELDRRRDSVAALHEALRRLRGATSVDELTNRVPHEAAKLGFDRVLFSWVENRCWVPVGIHTSAGPEEARAVMAAGTSPHRTLTDLLEGEMVRSRRSMIVRDALDHPRVHPDIQAVMHSHAYVAAPVVTTSGVVGFINADQNSETGTVDAFDRDLIAMFTEGVGLALERASLMDEVASIRTRVGRQADAMRALLVDIDDGEHHPLTDAPDEPRRSLPAYSLTRREEEVLGLVAAGLSNADIAARLYVAQGTAKTHVKNLLHKLGVENRAQAAAIFHRSHPNG
jgi:DNA-binding CsgD family transcriptional regulator